MQIKTFARLKVTSSSDMEEQYVQHKVINQTTGNKL